ncbi:S-acyltransferase [Thalictrum thalictroides]|uniref:S-acyltransferase n=1 Tax=Thalictrum thalictroides TaxID=46969 RepID=A0A7J6W1L0_THATH|nr:S-acyltransferase [Thalictrum thalictroides]
MKGEDYNHNPLPSNELSDSNNGDIIAKNAGKKTKRVYQAWKGNNIFFFGGRLVFGPDVRSLLLTLSLIVIPAFLFCAFISQRVVVDNKHHRINTLLAASATFTAYIIVLLFLTSGRDPGIIPRNAHPPELEDSSNLPSDWLANQGYISNVPPTKDVVVNGTVIKVKYCRTCMLYRPPRCSHCSICNNCVERFDHHCPWVGQCIGKRNYRLFFMFVSSTTIFSLYILVLCCLSIRNIMKVYQCNLWKALEISPVSGILIVYSFIGAWFVGGLTSFHVYLICTNQTTYENFRYRYDSKTNPHNIGLIRNVRQIFFSTTPRSKPNFRAKLKDDISPAVTTSLSVGHRLSPELPMTSLDIEMGGKRQSVVAEDLEDMQNQIETVTSLERCGPQPRNANWDHKGLGNWEIMSDIAALSAEFGMENRFNR